MHITRTQHDSTYLRVSRMSEDMVVIETIRKRPPGFQTDVHELGNDELLALLDAADELRAMIEAPFETPVEEEKAYIRQGLNLPPSPLGDSMASYLATVAEGQRKSWER